MFAQQLRLEMQLRRTYTTHTSICYVLRPCNIPERPVVFLEKSRVKACVADIHFKAEFEISINILSRYTAKPSVKRGPKRPAEDLSSAQQSSRADESQSSSLAMAGLEATAQKAGEWVKEGLNPASFFNTGEPGTLAIKTLHPVTSKNAVLTSLVISDGSLEHHQRT